jgi:hypothetical protein
MSNAKEDPKKEVETTEALKEVLKPEDSGSGGVGITSPKTSLNPKTEAPKDLETINAVGNSIPAEKLEVAPEPVKEPIKEETKEEIKEEDPPVKPSTDAQYEADLAATGKDPEAIPRWGRDSEFQELNSIGSISSGSLRRESAFEIGGLGSILKVNSYFDGVHTESLVFIPGASVIDLHENPEDKNERTGRVLAKR